MKQPVHPRLMRATQRKRESGIKLAVWTVIKVLVIAAWIGGLVLSYALGGSEVLEIVAVLSTAAVVFVALMGFLMSEDLNPLEEYLYRSRELTELANEIAWNSQQEELARLQRIMKDEGL